MNVNPIVTHQPVLYFQTSSLEDAKHKLEVKVKEQKKEIEDLEDELQASDDARLRLEVNLQAKKHLRDQEMDEKDKQIEELKKALDKQEKQVDNIKVN